MKGKGEDEGKAHQKDAEEFARKYVDEEQGRNRKHVLDTHKLMIKQALFRKNQHYTGHMVSNPELTDEERDLEVKKLARIPELTDEERDQEVMNQIERERMFRKAGGKRRRKTKRRYTKKRYTKKR